MKMNDQQSQRLYSLMQEKAFDELSDKEKAFVLQLISSEEYSRLRLMETQYKELMTNEQPDLQPDPAIKQRLRNHMAIQPSKGKVSQGSFSGILISIFSAKYIGMKTGLLTLLIAGTFWFSSNPKTMPDAYHVDSLNVYTDSFSTNGGDSSFVDTRLD